MSKIFETGHKASLKKKKSNMKTLILASLKYFFLQTPPTTNSNGIKKMVHVDGWKSENQMTILECCEDEP